MQTYPQLKLAALKAQRARNPLTAGPSFVYAEDIAGTRFAIRIKRARISHFQFLHYVDGKRINRRAFINRLASAA